MRLRCDHQPTAVRGSHHVGNREADARDQGIRRDRGLKKRRTRRCFRHKSQQQERGSSCFAFVNVVLTDRIFFANANFLQKSFSRIGKSWIAGIALNGFQPKAIAGSTSLHGSASDCTVRSSGLEQKQAMNSIRQGTPCRLNSPRLLTAGSF